MTPERDEKLYRSFRNIEGLVVRTAQNLNAYDVVLTEDILFLKEAIGKLKERLVK